MSYTGINVAMELLSVLVIGVLAFSQLRKEGKTRADYLFLTVLLLHMACCLGDAAAWGFNKLPGTGYRILTEIGNFLAYTCGSIGYFVFMVYIVHQASQRALAPHAFPRRMLWAMGALSALLTLLMVVNFFTGVVYSIDENNRFHWGEWFRLTYLLTVIQGLLLVIQIIRYRKILARRDMWIFLSHALLPGLAIIIGIWQYRLMLAYPAMMLALLLTYVNVQQEQEKRLVRQEAELANSRTSVMISQIQPHFLYNTLTSIQYLCRHDSARAEEAVRNFSKYLRGNMDSIGHKQPIPFAEELAHVRLYLSLEKMRFEERLQTVFDIQADAFLVPSLTLQPIVENAVRYGVTQREEGGTVTIRTAEEADNWRITIEDDGVGFAVGTPHQDGRTHTGIENVRQRLGALCQGTLDISSTPGTGTIAVISIPKGGGRA